MPTDFEDEAKENPSPDDKTLGTFYETLRKAVVFVQPEFKRERQITGPLLPGVIANLDDFHDPVVQALGATRSLIVRAAEAVALRSIVTGIIKDNEPGARR